MIPSESYWLPNFCCISMSWSPMPKPFIISVEYALNPLKLMLPHQVSRFSAENTHTTVQLLLNILERQDNFSHLIQQLQIQSMIGVCFSTSWLNSWSWVLGSCWVTAGLQMMTRCICPKTHIDCGFHIHSKQPYTTMCLRTFIWCCWADGHHHATSTIFVCLEFMKFAKLLGHSGAANGMWCHGAFVEAPDPHGMVLTSTPTNMCYKAFENIHMLLMGRWIHNHTTSTIFSSLEFREDKLAKILGHNARLRMMS